VLSVVSCVLGGTLVVTFVVVTMAEMAVFTVVDCSIDVVPVVVTLSGLLELAESELADSVVVARAAVAYTSSVSADFLEGQIFTHAEQKRKDGHRTHSRRGGRRWRSSRGERTGARSVVRVVWPGKTIHKGLLEQRAWNAASHRSSNKPEELCAVAISQAGMLAAQGAERPARASAYKLVYVNAKVHITA
jgi:hypothetical protein